MQILYIKKVTLSLCRSVTSVSCLCSSFDVLCARHLGTVQCVGQFCFGSAQSQMAYNPHPTLKIDPAPPYNDFLQDEKQNAHKIKLSTELYLKNRTKPWILRIVAFN